MKIRLHCYQNSEGDFFQYNRKLDIKQASADMQYLGEREVDIIPASEVVLKEPRKFCVIEKDLGRGSRTIKAHYSLGGAVEENEEKIPVIELLPNHIMINKEIFKKAYTDAGYFNGYGTFEKLCNRLGLDSK
jgi:hypothetical protein